MSATFAGARWCNGSRVAQAAEDAILSGWTRTDLLILALGWDTDSGTSHSVTIQFRLKDSVRGTTDPWRKVTGDSTYVKTTTGTVLVDRDPVVEAEERCTSDAANGHRDGEESTTETASFTAANPARYQEVQFALDVSGVPVGWHLEWRALLDGSVTGTVPNLELAGTQTEYMEWVKLTATGAANNANNPGNAQDSDDAYVNVADGFFPAVDVLARTTGDTLSPAAGKQADPTSVYLWGEIQLVEGGDSGELESWWDGTEIGSAPFTSGDEIIRNGIDDEFYKFDVTALRTWEEADFDADAKLEGRVDVSAGIVEVDQLAYQVWYTESDIANPTLHTPVKNGEVTLQVDDGVVTPHVDDGQ